MNNHLLRSKKNNIDNNYKIISILVIFILFKIYHLGIYPLYNGEDINSLYIIFRILFNYFSYCLLEYIIYKLFNKNKKIDNYFIISSLIITFIISYNINICIFIISSIIGIILENISKRKISSVIISNLLICIYLIITNKYISNSYITIFNYIYLALCLGSYIYLYLNKLIRRNILIIFLILFIFSTIILNNLYINSNMLFIIIFLVSDTRYSPLTNYGQILNVTLSYIIYLIFRYQFNIQYSVPFILIIYNLLSILINYLSIKLYSNKVVKRIIISIILLLYIFTLLYIQKILT